jgi:hypothetical protein
MQTSERGVVLVIMESGSEWPAWVEPLAGLIGHAVVVAQEPESPPAELALRAIHKISTLERVDRPVVMGVVAAGQHAASDNDDVFAARCLIARAMLTQMSGLGSGSIVFSCPEQTPDRARADLLELAGTLTNQLAGSDLSVGLRFETAPRSCGARHDGAQPLSAVG